jgi:hypothetical protein
MSSETRRALEDFDNPSDFERLAADVLNAQGYSDVKPMAPCGGGDGGQDIRFRVGSSTGTAFVTLNKDIKRKFDEDLSKLSNGNGEIALFCSVDVTPTNKRKFTEDARRKGFTLQIFDLERIRSLLDTTLKHLRRRYLHIDDEMAEKLRSDVRQLLNYPDAVPVDASPPTTLERVVRNKLPRRLFELLMRYNDSDVCEVPGVGAALHEHRRMYYQFRQVVTRFEGKLLNQIATIMGCEHNFPAACRIHLKYALMRFLGATKAEVSARGNFLNYDITWESAEGMFQKLCIDSASALQFGELHCQLKALNEGTDRIKFLTVQKNLDEESAQQM